MSNGHVPTAGRIIRSPPPPVPVCRGHATFWLWSFRHVIFLPSPFFLIFFFSFPSNIFHFSESVNYFLYCFCLFFLSPKRNVGKPKKKRNSALIFFSFPRSNVIKALRKWSCVIVFKYRNSHFPLLIYWSFNKFYDLVSFIILIVKVIWPVVQRFAWTFIRERKKKSFELRKIIFCSSGEN